MSTAATSVQSTRQPRAPTDQTRGPHGYRVLSGQSVEPNVFFQPAVLEPAFAYLAPRDTGHCSAIDPQSQLSIGVMPVHRAEGRYGPLPTPKPLSVWQHPYSVIGTPLVDADDPRAAINGLLDAAMQHDNGPPVLRLPMLRTDGAFWQHLIAVLDARGLNHAVTERFERAGLDIASPQSTTLRDVQTKKSNASIRKAKRRLDAHGSTELLCATTLPTLARALDTFFELEASGWKGERGTALKTIGHDGFFRTAILNLGVDRAARVYTTLSNGKAIASTVWIRSSAQKDPLWMPWKTAYDEAMRPFAPGTINLHEATADLLGLAAENGQPFKIDSLAGSDSVIAGRLWPHRWQLADLLIDLAPGGSVAYRTILLAETARVRARTATKGALRSLNALSTRSSGGS